MYSQLLRQAAIAFQVTPGHRDIGITHDGITAFAGGVSFAPVFTVASPLPWKAESNQTWLTVTPSGNTFRLSVAAGAAAGALEAAVTVTLEGSLPVVITVRKEALVSQTGFPPAGSWQVGGVVDIALAFHHVRTWNQAAFRPLLTWTNPDTQKEEWLFDSFILYTTYGHGFNFSNSGPNQATKANMTGWLDNILFPRNTSLDALDKELGVTIRRLCAPPRPRRVFLMATDLCRSAPVILFLY